LRINRFNSSSSSILSIINSLLGASSENEESDMESILQYLLANDPNKYGNPPTSKNAIEQLERIEVSDEDLLLLKRNNSIDCSVCKDDFVLKTALIKLPCNHYFHEDCLNPWLLQRNSCPTCRFELPTDDLDYEAKKNDRNNQA